jgi:hypothetical protein
MPAAFLTDDLNAVFFDVNEFATSFTLTPASGPAVVLKGIFDAAPVDQSVGAYGLESSGPQLVCASSDVPANWRGAAIAINGTAYVITKPEPDGTGMTTLHLHKA